MGERCVIESVHSAANITQIHYRGKNPQDPSQDDEKTCEPCLRWVLKGVLGFKGSAEAFVTSVLSSHINEIVMNHTSSWDKDHQAQVVGSGLMLAELNGRASEMIGNTCAGL